MSKREKEFLDGLAKHVIPYGSVFSGVEMAHHGFKKAGGFEPVFLSEIDPKARAVLNYRFPELRDQGRILGDMELIDAGRPGEDGSYVPGRGYRWAVGPLTNGILIGGSPCQDFSTLGKGAGEQGERGRLLASFLMLCGRLRPRYFILENVVGLGHHRSAMKKIYDVLGAMGYDVAHRVLDSKFWGVAQSRPRIFLVGVRNPSIPARAALWDLNLPANGRKRAAPFVGGGDRPGHPFMAHIRWQLQAVHDAYELPEMPADGQTEVDYSDRSYGGRLREAVFGTVLRGGGGAQRLFYVGEDGRLHDEAPTPAMLCRLFGLPDDWTMAPYQGEWLSESDQHRLLGNGFVAPVVAAIAQRIRALDYLWTSELEQEARLPLRRSALWQDEAAWAIQRPMMVDGQRAAVSLRQALDDLLG